MNMQLYNTINLCYVQEYFQIVIEFLKLEKVEFGGLRGRGLSEKVQEMFTDFSDMVNQLSTKSYDPLDPFNKVTAIWANLSVC